MLPRRQTLQIGTLAEATTRTQDWLEGLRWEIDHSRVKMSRADRFAYRKLMAEYDAIPFAADDAAEDIDVDEQMSDILAEMITIAENYLPAYCYLGATEGDGAHFGIWPNIPDEGEVMRVSDLSELPKGFSGEVLHVNERGNCTLYAVSRGNAREIWGIV